jgi:hypothetical protein
VGLYFFLFAIFTKNIFNQIHEEPLRTLNRSGHSGYASYGRGAHNKTRLKRLSR